MFEPGPVKDNPLFRRDVLADPDRVKKAIAAGFDVNDCPPRPGETALQRVARWGYAATAEVLLAAGADPMQCNGALFKPLELACIFGQPAVLEVLINYLGRPEDSTLMLAIQGESPACVQLILDAGVSANVSSDTGWSALHEACLYGTLAVVQTLAAAGADIHAGSPGKSAYPVGVARANGHYAIVDYLNACQRQSRVETLTDSSAATPMTPGL